MTLLKENKIIEFKLIGDTVNYKILDRWTKIVLSEDTVKKNDFEILLRAGLLV